MTFSTLFIAHSFYLPAYTYFKIDCSEHYTVENRKRNILAVKIAFITNFITESKKKITY
jgi:hypothetical protein